MDKPIPEAVEVLRRIAAGLRVTAANAAHEKYADACRENADLLDTEAGNFAIRAQRSLTAAQQQWQAVADPIAAIQTFARAYKAEVPNAELTVHGIDAGLRAVAPMQQGQAVAWMCWHPNVNDGRLMPMERDLTSEAKAVGWQSRPLVYGDTAPPSAPVGVDLWADVPKEYAGLWHYDYDESRLVYMVLASNRSSIAETEDPEVADAICRAHNYALAQQPAAVDGARPLDDWHEDDGPVVWWKLPVDEPAWIGTPLDSDWPSYHTHWTPHPAAPATQHQEPTT